jgi:hypothetical protein
LGFFLTAVSVLLTVDVGCQSALDRTPAFVLTDRFTGLATEVQARALETQKIGRILSNNEIYKQNLIREMSFIFDQFA